MEGSPLGVGIIGCGSVATNNYVPALRAVSSLVKVVACSDVRRKQAETVAKQCADIWPDLAVYADLSELLKHPGLDAVFNLTPAPLHGDVNRAALDAGRHVFSEKPLASSVIEADVLIGMARKADRLLLCAPGVMVTPCLRWVKEMLDSGRLGYPTVATATFVNLGPTANRRYTGDPAVFHSSEVGPVVDQGVYFLHALTGLLGPIQRLQAMGGVTIPQRVSVAPGSLGKTVTVHSNDVMISQFDFGSDRYGQLLSTYAAPATRAPQLEIHCSQGSISIPDILNGNGPIDVYAVDQSRLGLEGWMRGLTPPADYSALNVIGSGAVHFIRAILGLEEPVLTAEHAQHVLDVMLTMDRAAKDQTTHEVGTGAGGSARWVRDSRREQ